MNRISGSLAVLAGLFLLLPGIFAMLHSASTGPTMPGWMVRDLLVAALGGSVLMFWGGSMIRQRELQKYELEHVRVRMRG